MPTITVPRASAHRLLSSGWSIVSMSGDAAVLTKDWGLIMNPELARRLRESAVTEPIPEPEPVLTRPPRRPKTVEGAARELAKLILEYSSKRRRPVREGA